MNLFTIFKEVREIKKRVDEIERMIGDPGASFTSWWSSGDDAPTIYNKVKNINELVYANKSNIDMAARGLCGGAVFTGISVYFRPDEDGDVYVYNFKEGSGRYLKKEELESSAISVMKMLKENEKGDK